MTASQAAPGSHQKAAGDALGALAGRRTVLVVDDEDSIREMIGVILELEGYRVLKAADGPAGLLLALDEQPDLITLDVMMPGIDGWEVSRRLSEDPRTAAIPVVIISGKPLAELEGDPGRARVATVLTKPFDFDAFTTLVQKVMAMPAPRLPA
ncbi:MAG: response regulator [Actinomycetota bacterium]|nr:response regulator [Actinomycetota bacterium]